MIFFDVHIPNFSLFFFKENLKILLNYNEANSVIKKVSGINHFFNSQSEATSLIKKMKSGIVDVSDLKRREYGDFQTNETLAVEVSEYVFSKFKYFEFILEPTCGKGNFILAILKQSISLKKIVGIEIYQPYIWETKFKILSYFLSNEKSLKPDIDILHRNAFEFPYKDLAECTKDLKTLIIGNPPWVTNSELGLINSKNLPKKSNFKGHSGFEAITGKGNFDIGEYISLTMLKCFENHNGAFAFLIKNSVVKNIVHDQKKNIFKISGLEKLNIDSKKEFNASVSSCLFLTKLNSKIDFTCIEYDFYSQKYIKRFGWYKNKFVSSIKNYDASSIIDGKSVFIWRSGVKHDCSKIMELEPYNEKHINGLGEEAILESKLLYGLLKSSDLKKDKTNTHRKITIITQNKVGQETKYIKEQFPFIYKYLTSHKWFFEKRKSSIYKNRPPFSIFGIGDYSFKNYKVAISSLYKSTHFTLVYPVSGKPIMLDDTCYFIGFNELKIAEIAHFLLNSDLVQKFLKSIIFSDSKRSVNKDVLMRVDFEKAFISSSFEIAMNKIDNLQMEHWEKFGEIVKEHTNKTMAIF